MTDKKIVTAICQECGKQFEYELNPKYPRKYCFECSAAKKASYEAAEDMQVPVERPGQTPAPVEKTEPRAPMKEFHLSPEQVNTNALNAALEVAGLNIKSSEDIVEVSSILYMAKEFKEFIEHGN